MSVMINMDDARRTMHERPNGMNFTAKQFASRSLRLEYRNEVHTARYQVLQSDSVSGCNSQVLSNFYKMNQDPFPTHVVTVAIPDLGTGTLPIRFLTWLVPTGSQVITGERIAEILVDGIVFCVESDHDGVLIAQSVLPGTLLEPNAVIGRVQLTETP